MRIFLSCFAIVIVLVLAIAGTRGSLTRRTPLEVFPDMDRQLRLRPQTPNGFFANGRSSQEFVPGTVARSTPIQTASGPVYPYEIHPVNTGRQPGTTNFVDLNPLVVNLELLHRGRERYTIHCSPCHGTLGDGNGITKKYGMAVVGNLHDKRIVEMPDGEIFNTASYGKGLMQGYAGQVELADRWAIVAYVRALQLARLGTTNDVPASAQAALRN
jgi:mono/diheme cytochrome c family protein